MADSQSRQATREIPGSARSTHRILLVDNDRDMLELLAIGLADAGFEVRTATSGVEALYEIEQQLPDVLITDLIMPNISGEKLIRILHSVPEWKHTPTIVVSGVAMEAPELRRRIPCDIYIAKGPIAATLQYITDALRNFDRITEISQTTTIGADGIYSRKITRELLEFKEEVDQIMDHISDGVCKIDADMRVVWINRAYATLVGRPEEAILGRPVSSVVGQKQLPAIRKLVIRTGAPEDSVEVTLPPSRTARVTLLPGFEGNDGTTALIWQDVSERLLLEEQYENIVESSGDLIWTADLRGAVTYISGAVSELVGTPKEQIMGHSVWDATVLDDRDAFQSHILEQIERARTDSAPRLSVSEWRCSQGSGPARFYEVRISPLRDRGHRTIGIQGTVSEITRYRKLLEEKEALLHEVHHRVRHNLQLIGSLARISDPERLESRLGAFEEAFDELYREQTFAEIEPRPLVERITETSLANTGVSAVDPQRWVIEDRAIPMRQAVPLALLINEIIYDLARSDRGLDPRTLTVGLETSGETRALTITIGTVPESAAPESATTGMLAILADQLGGTVALQHGPGGSAYTIRFS